MTPRRQRSKPAAPEVAISLTADGYARARRHLMRRDPILGAAIKRIGACGMADRQRNDHLTALIGAIVSQQLSTKAAATIFGRFVALFPENSNHRRRRNRGAERYGAARRRSERPEGRLPARSVGAHRRRTAQPRRTRVAARRSGDRASDRGERFRALDGRDVPDVPSPSPRRAAGRRSRHRERHAAAVSTAENARTRSECRRSARRGGRIARSPPGTSGGRSRN